MPVIIEYIIKLNICLAVVYLFYQLFLRRLTFYNWNRWYLLGYTVLAFFIPLVDVMPSLQKRDLQEAAMIQWIPPIGFFQPTKQNFFETLTYWDWAIGSLLLGSGILLIRFIIRFYSFKKMKANAKLISDSDTKIYELNENITPFSFGNSIFINTELHDSAELEEIIRHEFIHVKQKHTIDIIWCELLCIINWFNPVVWLLRHNTRQNLEFIVDNKVLQNGLDKKEYQYLLLKVMGNRQFAFTNHFNFSSLKKRIAMMNTLKSAKIHLIKFMFLLPVVAVLLLSFRKEVIKEKHDFGNEKEKQVKETKNNFDKNVNQTFKKDTVPKKTFNPSDVLDNPDSIPLFMVDGKEKTQAEAKALDVNQIESVTILKDKASKELYGSKAKNGVVVIAMKKVNKDQILKVGGLTGKKPLFFVDGKQIEEEDFKNINTDDIKSMSVLKDKAATDTYGEKGKNGVIIIETKKGSRVDVGTRIVSGDSTITHSRVHSAEEAVVSLDSAKSENVKPLVRAYRIESDYPLEIGVGGGYLKEPNIKELYANPTNTYYILNGEPISKEKLKDLNEESIKSVDVLKGENAKKYYGEKAKNGAIVITTK